MSELKRYPIKYVRDRAKSRYAKGTECYICGSSDRLDFHHFYSLSLLLERWITKTGLDPNDVLEWRDRFIEEHDSELFEDAATLCHNHHLELHSIYGKNPALGTAKKQARWIQRKRDKLNG